MKKNILIVDDSPSLRKIIRHHLAGLEKFTFFEAGNGSDAEAVIQEQYVLQDPIDLILLDWMMPQVTGVQLLQRIRKVDIFSKLPKVIMLTAETYPDQIMACIQYDISAYLTKPFTREDLETAVLNVFNSGG